jgi:hypothetical protein
MLVIFDLTMFAVMRAITETVSFLAVETLTRIPYAAAVETQMVLVLLLNKSIVV